MLATPDPTVRPVRRPALALPRLACDAHVHVFGPQARFPFAAQRQALLVDNPQRLYRFTA